MMGSSWSCQKPIASLLVKSIMPPLEQQPPDEGAFSGVELVDELVINKCCASACVYSVSAAFAGGVPAAGASRYGVDQTSVRKPCARISASIPGGSVKRDASKT